MTTGKTVQISSPEGDFPAYEALPQTPSGKGVIVVQEAFGVNDHIEEVADRFAEQGYHAVAPHLFHRSGSPKLGYEDFSKVMPHMQALDDDKILSDVDATLVHLASRGLSGTQVGVVGFCMGGRVSFLVATKRSLGAGVGFYGGGIVTARSEAMPALAGGIATMTTPWLGLFGDTDQSIPVDDVETLRSQLASKAKVETDIVRYAQAGHGFFCDKRPSFDAEAAADAWPRTLAWFSDHLT
ncbi:MAG: dienelactone hydrolase family protein [Acidimicrobiales bacterium]